jgi:DNA-directed RNA polymerase specialized sigma subunit
VIAIKLSSRELEIIRLYFWHGYIEREIGEMLGLHRVTINRIKNGALLKLRAIIQN